MDDTQFIVNALNQQPFNKGLSLISFSKKSPIELVGILQHVIEEISPDQKIDLREEAPDMTAQRFFDFLWALKYKIPTEPYAFKNGLMNGDKNIINPVLFWMLQRITELRRRAYLAKYLIPIEVPPEMLEDPVYLEYKARQAEFRELHKVLESQKQQESGSSPQELKEKMQDLEQQKENLQIKLQNIRKKVEKVPNVQKLLQAAEALRREEDEQKNLAENLKEQHIKLHQTEQRLLRLKEKLRDLQGDSLDGGVEKQISKLEDEVQTNSFLVNKLPGEREEKKQRCDKLRKVLNEPTLTEGDRASYQGRIQSLRLDIKQLISKRDSAANKVDDKLAFYKQQFNAVEKKKQDKENSLKDLLEEKKELQKELKAKEEQLAEMSPGKVMLRGEALDKYVQELRRKTLLFKKYKAEQTAVRTEYGILTRTKEILAQKESLFEKELAEKEEARGVSGFQETQEKLEEVSQKKEEIDETKGKTLEEISKVVTQINQSIKDRKAKLAPEIKELRNIRQQYQELEAHHAEKKQLFDNVTLTMQSEKERIDQERQTYNQQAEEEETRYHLLTLQKLLAETLLKKADDSKDDAGEAFKDKYQRAIQEQEAYSKTLREKQKHIKESFEPNMKQTEMLNDLKKLLRCKLQVYSKGNGPIGGLESDEPDRLVLS